MKHIREEVSRQTDAQCPALISNEVTTLVGENKTSDGIGQVMVTKSTVTFAAEVPIAELSNVSSKRGLRNEHKLLGARPRHTTRRAIGLATDGSAGK
jgi:hypothetical protein